MSRIKKGDWIGYDEPNDGGRGKIGLALENENEPSGKGLLIFTEQGEEKRIDPGRIGSYAWLPAFEMSEVLNEKWDELNPEDDCYY